MNMKEVWLIFYEDVDVKPEVFMGQGAEEAAKKRFKQRSLNWSCHLFKKVISISEVPTKNEVSQALNRLSKDMLTVGVAMEYLGGFDLGWKEKSFELIGAAAIAKEWFDEIEIKNDSNTILNK